MTLNIEDPEAYELARKLADHTGETMTRAVTEALRERLDRVSQANGPKATTEELLAIGRRCAATLEARIVDHSTLLYGGSGLPK